MTGPPDQPAVPALESRDALDAVALTAVELARKVQQRPRRIDVRHGDTSIEIEWDTSPSPAAHASESREPAAASAEATVEDDRRYVCAPMVGTFYRAPEPGAKPYVEIGDLIEDGQQVCIVEAMKLMNAIQSDAAGRVVEILVTDAAPVEYGQPLIAVVPDDAGGER